MPGQGNRGFAERVALVTGGAHGVGRAVALQLALEGAYVIVSHLPTDEEGARVARELRELGTLAQGVAADVSDSAEVKRLFAEVDETFGRLDLLVNTTNVRRPAPLDGLTEEAWNEVLNGTLRSAFLCAQAATGLMRKRPRPAIVNVASELGMSGRAGSAHYVAAHAGMIGLTKALARELGPRIRVNCVAVGEKSDESGKQSEPDMKEKPVTPGPAPDEAARACIYLLSSGASAINGQTLVVGG